MGFCVQRLWFLLQPLGLGRSTQPESEWGVPPFIPTHGIPELDELLEKLEEVSTLFLFRSFVFNICITQYGKLTLKAAGVWKWCEG